LPCLRSMSACWPMPVPSNCGGGSPIMSRWNSCSRGADGRRGSQALGLANHVVPKGEALIKAREIARQLSPVRPYCSRRSSSCCVTPKWYPNTKPSNCTTRWTPYSGSSARMTSRKAPGRSARNANLNGPAAKARRRALGAADGRCADGIAQQVGQLVRVVIELFRVRRMIADQLDRDRKCAAMFSSSANPSSSQYS